MPFVSLRGRPFMQQCLLGTVFMIWEALEPTTSTSNLYQIHWSINFFLDAELRTWWSPVQVETSVDMIMKGFVIMRSITFPMWSEWRWKCSFLYERRFYSAMWGEAPGQANASIPSPSANGDDCVVGRCFDTFLFLERKLYFHVTSGILL